MKPVTVEQAKTMTLEEAKSSISLAVYEASRLLETLENAGLCHGNGHHARQKLAAAAAEQVELRWKKDTST